MTAVRDMLPAAAATIAATCLGASFVAIRYVIDQSAPGSLAVLRYGGALLCLAPFAVKPVRAALADPALRRDLPVIAVIGLLQFGLFQYFINSGLERIGAARGAVIFSMIPILTMAAAAVIGFEAVTWRKALATLLSIAGVSLALGDKAFAPQAAGWTGELLFFGGVCCGAVYNAYAGPLLTRWPTLPFTFGVMAPGFLFVALTAVPEGLFSAQPDFTPLGWAAVIFLALAAMSFALFNWALMRTTPTQAAIFVPVAPIVAAILGAWLLDEAISLLYIVGMGIVVAGIALATVRRGPAPAPQGRAAQ